MLKIQLFKLSRSDIQKHITCPEWQEVRLSMKGTSLEEKIAICNGWLVDNCFSFASKVQVINYINALKRSCYSKQIYNFIT